MCTLGTLCATGTPPAEQPARPGHLKGLFAPALQGSLDGREHKAKHSAAPVPSQWLGRGGPVPDLRQTERKVSTQLMIEGLIRKFDLLSARQVICPSRRPGNSSRFPGQTEGGVLVPSPSLPGPCLEASLSSTAQCSQQTRALGRTS